MKLFEDLPSTNKPITAENLNQIQDNLVVVSPTEPTGDNREKVWMQKGKNIVPGLIISEVRDFDVGDIPILISSTKRATIRNLFVLVTGGSSITASIASGYQYALYICDENKQIIYSPTSYSSSAMVTKLPSNAKYVFARIKNNNETELSETDLANINFQIEYGTEATDYEEHIEPKIYVKKENNVYELFISENKTKELAKESIKIEKINITLSDNLDSGTIDCFKSGSVVVVEVSDVKLKEDKAEWSTSLASGFPKPVSYGGWLKGVLLNNKGVIQVGNDGSFMVSERTGTQKASSNYTGQLVYMTTD